jgi:hypothetical protein
MSERKPLQEQVQNWLEKTGLPLELETASSFKKAGFAVEHSSVYADPQSEKGREIDVIAYTRDAIGMVQVYVAVECKSSANPWIVLVNRESEAVITQSSLGVMSELAKSSLPDDLLSVRSDVGFRLKNLHTNGYALRQAFCKENDPAYAAAMSAINAATALATKAPFSTPRMCFALPVIVVDAPIFECNLDGEGALRFREVASTEFLFTAYVPQKTMAVIRVASTKALPGFSSMLWRFAVDIKAALKPKVNQFVTERLANLRHEQHEQDES